MRDDVERAVEEQAALRRMAEEYLWFADDDEAEILADQIRAALGRSAEEPFDADAWAVEVLKIPYPYPPIDEDAIERRRPPVVRSGLYVGLFVDQWFNARNEILTAVQLSPARQVVLAEDGADLLEQRDIVAAARHEIAEAIARARFFGLTPTEVSELCAELLAETATVDYGPVWDTMMTLGDSEGIRPFVRLTDVELLDGYRTRVTFDDGVTRTLDLAPFLTGPLLSVLRVPSFFVQLRIANGTLTWPNGASLASDMLRYYPAVVPHGWEAGRR